MAAKSLSFDRMEQVLADFDSYQQEDNNNRRQLSQAKRLMYQVIQNELTDRQKEMLRLYFLQRMTMQQIAQRLNVNKSTVCRTINRALNRLRKYMQYYRIR